MKRWPFLTLMIAVLAACGPLQLVKGSTDQNDRDKKVVPLKINYVPRVKLPENATGERGWVRLKIEYRSDGTIGKIECINPDDKNRRRMERKGLIEASITAARKIEFRPRMVDGKPVTVFATREYVFNM